jgi:mycothiol synthase
MDDLEAALEIMNAYSRSQIGVEEDSAESLKLYWQSLGFDLSRDTIAIFTQPGQIAGYTEFWDWGEPHVRLIGWSVVHPDYMGRGLGRYLLDWLVERARRNAVKAPEGTRVVLQHYVLSTNQDAARLFIDNGFEHVRSNYTMHIEFEQPPQPPILPDGITIRAINGEEELRKALFTAHLAFKDHWGNANQPFKDYYQRTKQRIANDPHFDPALWFIALDGEEIAGVSLCSQHMDEDPDLAWVGTLGVLRDWRRRGIGQALLQHSFCEFYRRGKKRAGLGVDASSLTGAVRLYERAGMYVQRRYDCYELEIRPGKDIMKRSIEEPSKVEEK